VEERGEKTVKDENKVIQEGNTEEKKKRKRGTGSWKTQE
jgi:hypothetical protein